MIDIIAVMIPEPIRQNPFSWGVVSTVIIFIFSSWIYKKYFSSRFVKKTDFDRFIEEQKKQNNILQKALATFTKTVEALETRSQKEISKNESRISKIEGTLEGSMAK